MIRLVHKHEVMNRAQAVRFLLGAPQLAHVARDDFEAGLDLSVSKEAMREHRRGDACLVPYSLLFAYHEGYLREPLYKTYYLIPTFIAVHGRVCSLCLAIDSKIDNLTYSIAPAVLSHILDRPYVHVDSPHFHNPVCFRCSRSLDNRIYRGRGIHYTEDDVVAALTWLATAPSFIKRVQEHAGNLARLRFDPRKGRSERKVAA